MSLRLLCVVVLCLLLSPVFPQVPGISSSNLPLVVINTNGKTIIDASKIPANMKIIFNDAGQTNKPEDPGNIYSGNIGIEIRGAWSSTLPQKPYGIETRDASGANLNVSLLGMPAENDWILLANYNDKTFMRNALAYDLSRKMGHYAPRTRVVEVIVNNEYQGIYILMEKIKRDKGRVDIAKLTNLDISGDDVSGGYIFKIDYYNSSNSWQSSFRPIDYPGKTVNYVYADPDPTELLWQQKEYLKTAVNSFESVLYSSNFKDQAKGYPAWVNVNSFIDYFIVNELSRNVDGFKKSVYFFKDKDSKGGKINAGPVWDFDWAWKNIWDCSTFQATDGSGWSYKINDCLSYAPYSNGWMVRFLQDENFANALNTRYFELRKSFLSTQYLNSYIDSVQNLVNEAQARHYSRWRILGVSAGAPEVDSQPDSYAGVVYKFRNWIQTRLNWLDKNMPGKTITTSTEHFEITDNYRIFPNPASDLVYIESAAKINSLELYNTNGACILKNSGISAFTEKLDVSHLPSGIYFLHMKRDNKTSIVSKIVVQ
jgi:hypothetical protein